MPFTMALAGSFAFAEELVFVRAREVVLLARVFAVSARLEFHTASGGAPFLDLNMKGFRRGPVPAAIGSIVRPEATDRSSCSIASPSLLRANSSGCFISNQLGRLPPARSCYIP